MNKIIILLTLLIIIPTVSANYNSILDIKETAIELTQNKELDDQIYMIDLYLWNLNNGSYAYSKSRYNDLDYFWKTGIGDCTEIARVKKIMYRAIGLKTQYTHGKVNGTKHDYVEYHNGTGWDSTEYWYSNYTLRRVGYGIW